jgi:hypothetical protein
VHTADPLLPQASACEVESAALNLKRCKSPGVDQIPAELFQEGGKTLLSEVHILINLI